MGSAMVVAVAAAAGAPAPPSCAGTVISKHLPGAGASISQSYTAGKPGTPSATKNDGCGACEGAFVSFGRGGGARRARTMAQHGCGRRSDIIFYLYVLTEAHFVRSSPISAAAGE